MHVTSLKKRRSIHFYGVMISQRSSVELFTDTRNNIAKSEGIAYAPTNFRPQSSCRSKSNNPYRSAFHTEFSGEGEKKSARAIAGINDQMANRSSSIKRKRGSFDGSERWSRQEEEEFPAGGMTAESSRKLTVAMSSISEEAVVLVGLPFMSTWTRPGPAVSPPAANGEEGPRTPLRRVLSTRGLNARERNIKELLPGEGVDVIGVRKTEWRDCRWRRAFEGTENRASPEWRRPPSRSLSPSATVRFFSSLQQRYCWQTDN